MQRPPRSRPERHAQKRRAPTKTRILDAAEARFAAKGYDATSLGDIADDVRIRAPSLYKHFGGKRELYLAVLRRLLDPYFELLGGLLSAPGDATQASHNLEAVVLHYVRTPNLGRLVQHAALAGGEEMATLVERWYGPLFERATALTKGARPLRGPGGRRAIELVVAFHSFMSGYVTMAPLHARLTGEDPLGPAAIARYAEVLRGLVAGLWSAGPPARQRTTRPSR